MYYLANFFALEELKTLALKKFSGLLERLWFSERFVDCITDVFENTLPEDGLRKAVVRTAAQHRRELLQKRAFQNLLHQGGDFAVDLMQILAEPQSDRFLVPICCKQIVTSWHVQAYRSSSVMVPAPLSLTTTYSQLVPFELPT